MMNLEQIEVFVQYLCGDTVKVTVPAISVGIPVVPTFVMPIIGECPDGTMADPKTYISNVYPLLFRDSYTNSVVVTDLAMKSIYRSSSISYESYRVSSEIADVYLKSINIGSMTTDTCSQLTNVEGVYLKSINIESSVNDIIASDSDVIDITMINLNKFINVKDSLLTSATVLTAEMAPSPRIVLGETFGDNVIEGFTADKAVISGVSVLDFLPLDKLRTEPDAFTANKGILSSVSVIVYNNYIASFGSGEDNFTASKATLPSVNTITYVPNIVRMDLDNMITSNKAVLTSVSVT